MKKMPYTWYSIRGGSTKKKASHENFKINNLNFQNFQKKKNYLFWNFRDMFSFFWNFVDSNYLFWNFREMLFFCWPSSDAVHGPHFQWTLLISCIWGNMSVKVQLLPWTLRHCVHLTQIPSAAINPNNPHLTKIRQILHQCGLNSLLRASFDHPNLI